jgi:hypothetical protein
MRATAASLPREDLAREEAAAELSVPLAGGAQTTAHVVPYELESTEIRAVKMSRPQSLAAWCAKRGIEDAIGGGFFVRSNGKPLGELRTRGIRRRTAPFLAPWDEIRACVHVVGREITIARRPDLPSRPRGDLLQAGPLLVAGGEPVHVDGLDPEGFSAGQSQFDSDITDGRYPRAALGLGNGMLMAVAVDGRAPYDAGMTLEELATFMAGLGCETALNLDGGGSAALVCGGRMINRPREADGGAIPNGRAIVTALAFLPR